MNVKTVQISPTKNGEPIVRAVVKLIGAGINVQAQTSSRGIATFDGKILAGKTVDVMVNGDIVKKGLEIPADHPNGTPLAKIEIVSVAASHTGVHDAPHTDAHAATPSHGAPEEDGYVVIVRDAQRRPISGALVSVSPEEGYLTLDGEAIVPFFHEETEVTVSRYGYKTKKVMIDAEDETVKVTLESEERATIRPKAYDLIRFVAATVFLAGLIFLGFNAPQGAINLDMPLAIQTGIQVVTWLVLTGSICATVFAVADRVYRKQFQDIKWAFLALVLFQLGGWNWLIGLVPVGLGQYGLQAIFLVAALLVLYVSSISGTPDFTTPGVFWLINVSIAMLFGTFGPISDWMQTDGKLYTMTWLLQGLDKGLDPKFTLMVIGTALFAGLHFVLDLTGLFVKGEDPAEKYGSLTLTAILVAGTSPRRSAGSISCDRHSRRRSTPTPTSTSWRASRWTRARYSMHITKSPRSGTRMNS